MIVGVDGREVCDQPAGKGQYLLRILSHWRTDPGLQLVIYLRPGQKLPSLLSDGPAPRAVAVGGWSPAWHYTVSRRLKKDGIEVFFAALSYQSAVWNAVPTVTVVHDLAVFRLAGMAVHNRNAWLIEHLFLKRCMRRSAAVITVSESGKNDLLQLTSIDPKKVRVISEAPLLTEEKQANNQPVPMAGREPFFLFVGTLQPRKNIGGILKAFATLPREIRARYTLKLAGKPGWGGEDYPELATQLGIAGQTQFLGYVSDEQLAELYRKATLLVYPSFYEGFGLPVIEALAVGTPVVTSTVSSLPEVLGDGGIACDPGDPAGIARAIQEIISDARQYEKYSRAGYRFAERFSWEKAAQQTKAVIAEVIR
ncbi:glycosyltransferase family 4 protein [Patescibacteria group bacterium]|nr:glycosyltransferase family 4 protein [Patescibacteria group bacterium]